MPEQQIDLYDVVSKAVVKAVAIRAINKLLPAEGEGGKVMPPTFSDRQYAWEDRERAIIILDTVASHANRQEVLLGESSEELKLPVLCLRFRDPDQDITAYQASHRVFDALFRDAVFSGRPFRTPLRAPAPKDTPPADNSVAATATAEATPKTAKTAKPKGRQAAARGDTLGAVEASVEGTDLERAGLDYATPLFQLAPHCLIYGCWDSTGSAGGLGAKFARAVESRVTGHGARLLQGTRGKLDAARLPSFPIYRDEDGGWTTEPHKPDGTDRDRFRLKADSEGVLSEVNHSSVTPDIKDQKSKQPLAGGVTIDFAVQRWVLSVPALRCLCFPEKRGAAVAEDRNLAARTVLALLALCGLSRLWDKGLWFRSGCTLAFDQEPQIEIVYGRGKPADRLSITTTQVEKAYLRALTGAEELGLKMRSGLIGLEPAANLREAYRLSRTGEESTGADADSGD